MSETQVSEAPETKGTKGSVNRSWTITLFGTAVGAGVCFCLFLPVVSASGLCSSPRYSLAQ